MRQQAEAQKAATEERNALRSLYEQKFGGPTAAPGMGSQPQFPSAGVAPGGPGMTAAVPQQGMSNQDFTNQVVQITGDPKQAMEWNGYLNSLGTAERERDKAEAPLFVAALEGVQDQAGYDQARQFLTQRGVDVSDMAPQ